MSLSKPVLLLVCSDPIVIEQHLHEIICQLSKTVNLMICTNLQCISKYPIAQGLAKTIKFIDIKIIRKPSVSHDLVATFRLLSVLYANRIDFVLSFTPKGGLISSLSVSIARLILCRHIFYAHYFTGLFWQNLSKLSVRYYFFREIDRFIVNTASKIYCDSSAQLQLLLSTYHESRDVFVLQGSGSLKGVNTSCFRPTSIEERNITRSRLNISHDSFVLLFMGRITADKGIQFLLDAFQMISDTIPKSKLVIVGPIEDKPFEYLNTMESSNIIYLPFSSTPWNYYNLADILVLPSKREGFGSVIIEAAACSIPSIGTSIPGLRDSILHLQTGLLYECGNIEMFINSVKFLYQHPKLRKQFGSTAYHRVISNFSQSDVIDRFVGHLTESFKFEKNSFLSS